MAGRKRRRGERGTGTIYRTGDQTWAFRWVENGSRRFRGGLSFLEATQAQERATRGLEAFPDAPRIEAVPTIGTHLAAFWAWREGRALKTVRDDQNRWRHLAGLEGMTLGAISNVELERVRAAIETQGLSPATVGLVFNLLSSFYKFALGAGVYAGPNPVTVYRAYLGNGSKVIRSNHDPKDTPFLERPEDSLKLFQKLQAPFNIAYALSRWAGLRPGEVRGLEWSDVNLSKALITIRYSVRSYSRGTPKSGANRIVPFGAQLAQWLKAWRAANPAAVLVCPALPRKPARAVASKASADKPRNWSPYLNEAQMNKALEIALVACGLPPLTFYEAGRHSFASEWAIAGRSIYELSKILGHASVTTTERYAHLGGTIKPLEIAS